MLGPIGQAVGEDPEPRRGAVRHDEIIVAVEVDVHPRCAAAVVREVQPEDRTSVHQVDTRTARVEEGGVALTAAPRLTAAQPFIQVGPALEVPVLDGVGRDLLAAVQLLVVSFLGVSSLGVSFEG